MDAPQEDSPRNVPEFFRSVLIVVLVAAVVVVIYLALTEPIVIWSTQMRSI